MIIALQQLFMPKMQVKRQKVEETGIDIELMERVRQLKEDMAAFELKPSSPAENNNRHGSEPCSIPD